MARACDAVARAAAHDDVARNELRPLIKLAHRLGQHPDWTRLHVHEIAKVLDEQIQLADEVDLLLRELILPGDRTKQPPGSLAIGAKKHNIDPPANQPNTILTKLEVPDRHGRAKQDRTASNNLPATRGQVSRDRDFDALKLARQWDDEQRDWTQKQLAQSLDVDRSQIFGKKDGRYRCPSIASYWKARQAEKQGRKDNMRKHNRTTEVADDNES